MPSQAMQVGRGIRFVDDLDEGLLSLCMGQELGSLQKCKGAGGVGGRGGGNDMGRLEASCRSRKTTSGAGYGQTGWSIKAKTHTRGGAERCARGSGREPQLRGITRDSLAREGVEAVGAPASGTSKDCLGAQGCTGGVVGM